MKKLIILSIILLTSILAWAFKNQETKKASYITVTYGISRYTLMVYYGASKPAELIEFKRGENFQDKIMDTLNGLSDKGYELVTSNSHYVNAGQTGYVEYNYTLKLK